MHRVVRAGLASLQDDARPLGGLPRDFLEEVKAFLKCGVLAHGFTRVRCETCGDESLVAFSCKGRGLCPSCSARRAHVTAAHLVDDVLPKAPYRQWTLSFPYRLRWVLVKTPRLLARLQRLLFAAIAVEQRRVARRRGLTGRLHTGAVVMTQYFGSALQLTPHFHGLVPDGVFIEEGGAVRFEALPPPTPEDVARLARRFVVRVQAALEKAGVLEDLYPEDALEVFRQASLQERLPWAGDGERPPRALHGRVAVVEGFSLHADTAVHENDRDGLARLARYGARGPLASSRVTQRDDGVVEYRRKRTAAHGAGLLVMTAGDFLRRLAALVPPPGKHLVHFHGALAPHARVRKAVVALVPKSDVALGRVMPTRLARPSAPQQELLAVPPTSRPLPAGRPARPRLDWAGLLRRTFALDVLTCTRCGGRRRVEAVVTDRDTARDILLAHGLPHEVPPTGPPPRRRQLALPL